ncbi:carbohydrate ABC transporter permease [Niallia sp. 01092]|uniref:carbohydrate ABC transporter permease n=1 Tax=Niallia sp. 01092 TaxID=3457759 RepID=UPI003FD5B055
MLAQLSKRTLLIIFAAVILFPISVILLSTFKTTQQLFESPFSLSSSFHIENYKNLITDQPFGLYFTNSLIVTSFSVLFTLFFASMIAYAISQVKPWAGRSLFSFFVMGLMVPAQVNMLPLYQLISKLQLTNSLLGLVIVNIAGTLPVAVLILSGFVRTIPASLFEASKIDGANNWQIYRRIFLPLSSAPLASTGIFLSVMYWNDLINPLLYITDDSKKTLPLMLIGFQGEYLTNYPMLFTGVVLSSLPMVLTYLFLQKYFIAGMTAGAVKS